MSALLDGDRRRIKYVVFDADCRAAVRCESALGETLYLTQLSPQALQRRAEKAYAI